MLLALPCDLDDRYTLTAELGRGSHAIVYRAFDNHLGREVAVKVLREELLGSDVSVRFRREIRLTARLEHPHIAHVYGTGEFRGTPFFVVALARGTTLGERLRHEHQLPIAEALAITLQVASALQHAHAAGIIHRDVKPENVLLTPEGALLSDFGVARALEHSPGTLATSTGVAVGTLLYMSPEQLCAEKDVDARSDQYALALMLYEMLAGVPAHVAANAEGLRGLRIIGQHAPLRMHRPTVPEHVEAAVRVALAPAPADRFTDMTAFIAALDGRQTPSSFRVSTSSMSAQSLPVGGPLRRWVVGSVAVAAVATAGVLGANLLPPKAPPVTSFTAAMAKDFTIVSDGDAAVTAALANELRLWSPDIGIGLEIAGTASSAVLLETLVTPLRDGVRMAVQLRPSGASASTVGRIVQVTLPAAAAPRADSLRLLAARVLLASQVNPDSVEQPDAIVEPDIVALRSYGDAWVALLAGDLPKAERAFADAARTQTLPQAVLWQVTVASWRRPRSPAVWRAAASAAQASAPLLSRRDSLLAEALRHRANDRMPLACDAYTRATRVAGGSFAAWYGLGECLRMDSIVVLDTSSPTGARFRTSRWVAENAYEEAIARLPSAGLVPLFSRLPAITLALHGTMRSGALDRAAGPTYSALPSLVGDSVTVFPARVGGPSATQSIPLSYQAAVRLLRRRLLTLGAALVQRAPQNVGAHLAYASALETNGALDGAGDSTAMAVLRSARRLSRSAEDTLDVAIAEVRVLLRTGDFSGARSVVTPILAGETRFTLQDVHRRIPLALLTGRVAVAESLLVRDLQQPGPGRPDGVPPGVAKAVARYTLASALGDCRVLDGLRTSALESVRSALAQSEVPVASKELLAEGDWMRLTCAGAPLPDGVTPTAALLRASVALRTGDRVAARMALLEMRQGRDGAAASSVAWDTRFAETWMLVQAGDTIAAQAQMVSALADLSDTMDYVLRDVTQVSGFLRAMAFYDSLATVRGDAASASRARDVIRSLSASR